LNKYHFNQHANELYAAQRTFHKGIERQHIRNMEENKSLQTNMLLMQKRTPQ